MTATNAYSNITAHCFTSISVHVSCSIQSAAAAGGNVPGGESPGACVSAAIRQRHLQDGVGAAASRHRDTTTTTNLPTAVTHSTGRAAVCPANRSEEEPPNMSDMEDDFMCDDEEDYDLVYSWRICLASRVKLAVSCPAGRASPLAPRLI